METASVHKGEGIEEAVAARGATLFYIPAYSPDFSPIEQFFAKLKSILRKIAAYTLKGIAFTVDSLCKAIVFCLDQIPRAECAAYLANSGYGQPKREALLVSLLLAFRKYKPLPFATDTRVRQEKMEISSLICRPVSVGNIEGRNRLDAVSYTHL